MLVAGPMYMNKAFFQEWNQLPESIIEAANTEVFKLALRAQGPVSRKSR